MDHSAQLAVRKVRDPHVRLPISIRDIPPCVRNPSASQYFPNNLRISQIVGNHRWLVYFAAAAQSSLETFAAVRFAAFIAFRPAKGTLVALARATAETIRN